MRQIAYRRILVLLDATDAGERGLHWVRALTRGTDALVQLLMVTRPARAVRQGPRIVTFVDQLEGGERAAALFYLGRVAGELRDEGLAVEIHARTGRPLDVAWGTAEALSADLVVLSITDIPADVVRSAPVPVLVAGPACLRSA
jgi:nucleotide-binding universal stress UspA family protein